MALQPTAMRSRLQVMDETLLEEKGLTSPGKSIEAPGVSETQALVITLATSALTIVTGKLFELLLPLLGIIFGFIIWRSVMASPDTFQLVGLALYGAFVLVPTILFRKK